MSIAVPAIPAPYIHATIKRRKNTWYTQKDGNWSDPSVWESNASKRWSYPGQNIPTPIFPQVGDDVYINNNITANVNVVVNNLRVSGDLTFANYITISVNGDIQATGTVDMTRLNPTLMLYGVNNFVTAFICGTSSTVNYARIGYQIIMNLSYYNLTMSGQGIKEPFSILTYSGKMSVLLLVVLNTKLPDTWGGALLISGGIVNIGGNTAISGNTDVLTSIAGGCLNAGNYDLSFGGYFYMNSSGALSKLTKAGTGTIIFTGLFTTSYSIVDFSGNPNLEFRGGISQIGVGFGTYQNWGTGNFTATTNNQTWSATGVSITVPSVQIVGAISLTISGVAGITVNSIDGTSSGSALINKGFINFSSTILPMPTFGTYDFTSFANVIGYSVNANYTLPYTSYVGLSIGGTGTKKLGGTTTVGTSGIVVSIGAELDLNSHNLTNNGTTAASGLLSIKAFCSVIFVGAVNLNAFDYSGNPNIEFRGGMTLSAFSSGGNGNFTFSTNNQTIRTASGGILYANIIISGVITVTTYADLIYAAFITGTINGDNASSIFDNRGVINYRNAAAPMITGKLYCNQAANTFIYGLTGDQDIQVPSDTTSGYKNLTLEGSGAKKLLGNVSVKGTYLLSSPATLNSNGYSLTNP